MKLFFLKLVFLLIVSAFTLKSQAEVDPTHFDRIMRVWDGTFFYRFVTVDENENYFRFTLEGNGLEKILETPILYGHISFSPKPRPSITKFVIVTSKKGCVGDTKAVHEEKFFLACLVTHFTSKIQLLTNDALYEKTLASKGVIRPVWGEKDLKISILREDKKLTLNLTTNHAFPLAIFEILFFDVMTR